MPPRKPIDPNAPVPGSDQDATQNRSSESTEQSDRGTPQQGKPVHFRGKVTDLPDLTESRGRAKAYIGAEGALFTNDGQQVSEPRDWTVIAWGGDAREAKEYLKLGDEIKATGRWLEERFVARGVKVDNEIQAFDVSRPLGPALGLEAAAEVGGVVDRGGLSVGP